MMYVNVSLNVVILTPTDGPVPLGATAYAHTVMTNFASVVYVGSAPKRSAYLPERVCTFQTW